MSNTFRYTKTKIVPTPPKVLIENRVVMGLYNDPRADIFRVLRTNILRQLRDNKWNTFAVTSASPGVGKSFIAVNLALAIALEGNQSVLLVDADLRRPSVATYFDLNNDAGLVDYLTGTRSLEDILINPGFPGLVILPGGSAVQNASELISSGKMDQLVKDIASRYDSRIVIFDIPPLFVSDDALLFMSYVDGVLFVIEDGKTTKEELKESMSILEQTNLLGLVLNKTTDVIPRYNYSYTYMKR